MNLNLKIGDITEETVDAIVNAANNQMLGGGGVDGAIHRAAGSQLVSECRLLPVVATTDIGDDIRCPTGEAKITKGYNLPAKYIIHTVGPKITSSVTELDKELLYAAWYNSLSLANDFQIKTIAFPSISTGGYCFPIKEASKIAIDAIKDFQKDFPVSSIEDIFIVTFSEEDFIYYKAAINNEEIEDTYEKDRL